jgi:mannuronan 5-epimerase
MINSTILLPLFAIIFLLIEYSLPPPSLMAYAQSTSNPAVAACITYGPAEKMITIACGSASLTDVNNQLKDPNILQKGNNGEWLLNAGITVAENAALYINSSDTSWLKISADGATATPIRISGGLKIDSVKITSWNPTTNNYALSPDSNRDGKDVEIGTPRPYIVVEPEATGTADITNSEVAYLGYESGYGGGLTGLRYEGGHGSTIRGNDIHNLYFAFYSKGVGGLLIENNHIHDNIHYGLDPHTGTHDMTIRNNTVHDNGSIGIICSLDCFNITIENNTAYNNAKMGIMFSRNMHDSVARNNIVSDEDKAIVISESINNSIYNNTVTNSSGGIDLDKESSGNAIHNNIVKLNNTSSSPSSISSSLSDAISIEEGAEENNKIFSNAVIAFNGTQINYNGESQDSKKDG